MGNESYTSQGDLTSADCSFDEKSFCQMRWLIIEGNLWQSDKAIDGRAQSKCGLHLRRLCFDSSKNTYCGAKDFKVNTFCKNCLKQPQQHTKSPTPVESVRLVKRKETTRKGTAQNKRKCMSKQQAQAETSCWRSHDPSWKGKAVGEASCRPKQIIDCTKDGI